MKKICAQCGTELKPLKNGVTVIETIGNPSQPFKIWDADLWGCPECETKLITDFGMKPISTKGDEDFDETLGKVQNLGIVIYVPQTPKDMLWI
jgi:hypothetical protein